MRTLDQRVEVEVEEAKYLSTDILYILILFFTIMKNPNANVHALLKLDPLYVC